MRDAEETLDTSETADIWAPWWWSVPATAELEALVAELIGEVAAREEWTLTRLVLSGDADAEFVAEMRGVVL